MVYSDLTEYALAVSHLTAALCDTSPTYRNIAFTRFAAHVDHLMHATGNTRRQVVGDILSATIDGLDR